MTDPADARLDDTDQAILDRLATIHRRLDPPPADLDERTRFGLALDEVDIEVARLSENLLVGSGARSTERTRTITFDADSRTIMVTIVDRSDGRVRLDGWLAPAAALRVELRLAGPADAGPADAGASVEMATSDASGRFVFDGIPHGLAQIVVRPPDDDSTAARVVTPSLLL
jgi:hypothetical protein